MTSKETTAEKSSIKETRLSQYLRPAAVLDLEVDSKEALLRSLAEVVIEKAAPETVEAIYQAILEREAAVNTYVGDGVAIPHARVDGVDGIALALARNPIGLPYERGADEPVRLAVLVVSHERLKNEHVRVLGMVASLLKDKKMREKILIAPDAAAVLRLLNSPVKAAKRRARPLSYLLLSYAQKIAAELGVTSVIVSIENREELAILKRLRRRTTLVVASSDRRIAEEAEKLVRGVVLLPNVPVRRDTRVRLTALMALAHGLVKRGDVVAFLSGNENGELDTMTILELGRDFGRFFAPSGELSPGVQPIVLERVITLAAELGMEGREGRPVGTIFVVGDPDRLSPFCQQMVMNPFRGYPEEERNLLDPTLGETIKEFAAIDGAFVVRGDGVVISAGTYLKVTKDVDLPGGYGSRHRAACAITSVENCLAVALSQSSGEVTVFRKGGIVLSLPQTVVR